MFRKNLVLELWSKKLKAIQNAGFFELVYLTNKVRYEVEFLDVTRGPLKRTIIKWLVQKGCFISRMS